MPQHARAQRLARGWIVGLVATTVAAVSHSLAGGSQPGLLSFGTALVFAGILGTLVIGSGPSLPRLVVAVGASQLAFHLLFALLGSERAPDSGIASSMIGMTGMPGMHLTPVTAPLAMSTRDHLANPWMWIAHAIAAGLTILFLRRAELAVWAMLTRLGQVIATRLTVVLAPVSAGALARIPSPPSVVRGPVERLLSASASRRGPPRLAF